VTPADQTTYLRRLRFPQPLEAEFQQHYFRQNTRFLRSILLAMALPTLFYAMREWYYDHHIDLTDPNFQTSLLFLLKLGVTFHRQAWRLFYPAVIVAGAAETLCYYSFSGIAELYAIHHTDRGLVSMMSLWIVFLALMQVFMALAQRLPARWAALYLTITLAATIIRGSVQTGLPLNQVLSGMVGTLPIPVLIAVSIAYFLERTARGEFIANRLLAQERDSERRQREQTEGKLQVLGQAIGGIVHDLGNPLTAVRTGAQTLLYFVEDDEPDKAAVKEFAEIITDGAQMLDYLRLSLMEQTRVLEGKPIPLECKFTSIRPLIEAGARYQKPKFASGRQITVQDEDMEIYVDEMKMITVFMNLIGNALKYSDGEVRITWRMDKDISLIAIMDQGQQGRGISRDQAELLFVAFGRLETHAQVEGTGLGLLSVKSIIEAHGGVAYIEGYTDGTPATLPFTTAYSNYPPLLLDEGFHSAFVVTCPLPTVH